MPRSKRDKRISLTRALKKRGMPHKQRLVDDIRRSVEKYATIYHFKFENLNNYCLNEFRKTYWVDSRLVLSKNRIMRLGLGRTKATEAGPELHRLSKHLSGQSGLLFTNKPFNEVTSWFREHAQSCLAQPGERAARTVKLQAGPLPQISSALEPYLRKLGLCTELKHGQVNLLKDYPVCTEGEIVKANNARVLKVFGEKVGTFRMCLKRVWSKQDGTCKKIDVNVIETGENCNDAVIGY